MDISAVIMAYNEEEQIPKLFKCIHGVSEIILLDHNSTDNTAQIAKDLGATVYTREFPGDFVMKEDIGEFEKRFGYLPEFKEGDKIFRGGEERAFGGSLAKNDWILNIDCDEFVTWNPDKIKEQIADCDILSCKFVHDHNPDGSAKYWFQIPKLYNKKKTWWVGRIHEYLDGYNLRIKWTDDMVIDHWQKPRDRRWYVSSLEYVFLKECSPRFLFYMGKEYLHYNLYEKSIKILQIFLKEGVILAEKVRAHLFIAASFFELGREDEAWVYAMLALKLDPTNREIYDFLVNISPQKDKSIWKKHADIAEYSHLM